MAKDRRASESVAETYKEKEYQSKTVSKDAFSQLFDQMLKAYTDQDNEYGEPEITKKEVGERLGIGQSLFQKRINWEKPTTTRDVVIAICMVLKADVPDINEALYLHDMPGLDPDYPRDEGLLEIIYHYGEKPLTIDIINERLQLKNVEPLYIPHRGNKKEEVIQLPYKVLGRKAEIIEDSLIYGDIFDSLCMEYHPSLYQMRAEMWVEHIESGKQYELYAYTDGYRFGQDKKIQFEIAPVNSEGYVEIFKRKPCDPKGEYSAAFREMNDLLEKKLRVCLTCLNDTRNYQDRVSARIINDELHVFCEVFNLSIPELHDYYLVDFCSGEYKLYRSKDSMFMKWYLPSNEYKKYYTASTEIYKVDLNRKVKTNPAHHFEELRLGIENRLFKKMISRIEELYQKLINGTAKIRNIECIDEIPSSAITYYGLDEMFEYTREMTEDEILLNIGKESITIPVNEEDIEITVDDVYTGFELGCEDITEIARLKQKHKSLKNIYQ